MVTYNVTQSKIEDFIEIKQFATRLIAHGYRREDIQEIFITAYQKFDKYIKRKNKSNYNNDTLYLHWKSHPSDISKSKLHLYNDTLQTCNGFNNFIICYYHPKNLKDNLMETKLFMNQKERKYQNFTE